MDIKSPHTTTKRSCYSETDQTYSENVTAKKCFIKMIQQNRKINGCRSIKLNGKLNTVIGLLMMHLTNPIEDANCVFHHCFVRNRTSKSKNSLYLCASECVYLMWLH